MARLVSVRWIALGALTGSLALAAGQACAQVQPPPATAQVTSPQRAAKLAESKRLSKAAGELRAAGKFDEALQRLARSIAIQRELFGPGSEGEAEACEQTALNELDLEHWAAAGSAAAEALAARQRLHGPNDWRTIDARLLAADVARWEKLSGNERRQLAESDRLLAEADQLQQQGKYRQALAPVERSLALRRQVLGEDHRSTGDAWGGLGFLHHMICDVENAEAAYQHALQIRRQALGETHPDHARSLNNLAALYRLMGDYARAEPLYRRALEIRKQALGETHPDYATTLNNLAALYYSLGDYARAEPPYRQALEIQKQALGETHPEYASSLNNLAVLYKSMGDYARAEPLYRQALEIRKQGLGEKHPDYARALNDLAALYRDMGNYARAEPLYRQAVEVYKQALGESHPDYAASLSSLALLYDRMGDYARAEPLFRRTLKIDEQALGGKNPYFATDLNSLAVLYSQMGDYAQAEPLFRQALEIRKQALGETHPDYATTLNDLAGLYRSRGDYARAEPLYRQAVEVYKQALGEKHPTYATSLNNLASLYFNMGDYARAGPLHRQAMAIRAQALGETHPDYASDLVNVALVELASRHPAVAEKLLRQAVEIQRKSLDLAAAVQSEQQQLAMLRQLRFYLDDYLSGALAAGVEPGKVYLEVAAWKGSVSAQQQLLRARQRALAGGPDSRLGRLFAQLDGDTRRLANLMRRTPQPGEEAKLRLERAGLTETVNTLQQQLSRLDADFHRVWAEREISSEELSRALPPGTALVDLLEYDHFIPLAEKGKKHSAQRRVIAFVLRRDQPVACVELGASDSIHALVATWRPGFGTLPAPDGEQPGPELRRRVWQPLEKHLAGAQTVLISPDGALAELPWGALPGDTAGKYLIEERAIAVIAIPQLLPELTKSPAHSGPPATLLVAGDIDYGGNPGAPTALAARSVAARRNGQLEFKRLDSAQAELASICDWYQSSTSTGRVDLLHRQQATEAAFRNQAPNNSWLHLITHGFFAGAGGSKSSEPVDPGLLCGLAFAGANTPPAEGQDDGILTALEVSSLDLSKVDAVVLSACETGLGRSAGGEGLLGLQRAFQVAGAKTVVASLWKVPDAATGRLMQRYYENMWGRKLGKLAALREAQLFMLRDQGNPDQGNRKPGNRGLATDDRQPAGSGGLPPFYWAAFVLSGDWR
ncbi:MAG TPA: CHAT domain-containing tetratricopeptide repeat protein [Pirellulales bacterium]